MNGFVQRIYEEINYLTRKNWSLKDIGIFWDKVDDYDDINSKIYPYYKRFSNSLEIFKESKIKIKPKNCLDIQTRTGNGSIFWAKLFPKCQFYICDFSKVFLKKSEINLKKKKVKFQKQLVQKFPLPFKNNYFEFVITYETIEHVSAYKKFIKEISRVTKKEGIVILTCPNTSWDLIHSFTAIIGINHSEGPHKFLKTKDIETCLRKNKFKILKYNTTIFFPFNNKISIFFDNIVTNIFPNWLKKLIFLRHSYILKKIK